MFSVLKENHSISSLKIAICCSSFSFNISCSFKDIPDIFLLNPLIVLTSISFSSSKEYFSINGLLSNHNKA